MTQDHPAAPQNAKSDPTPPGLDVRAEPASSLAKRADEERAGLSRRDLFKSAIAASLLGAAASSRAGEPTSGKPVSPHDSVVVVGAGAFGGWTALHLLRRGARVTLVDSWGPGNSRASSGGETRVIRGIYGPDRIYTQWVARSFELWRESGKAWGTDFYRKTGALWMLTGADSYVRDSLPFLRDVGLEVRELDLAAARREFPQVEFAGVKEVFHEAEAGYLLARRACGAVVEAFVREGGDYRVSSVQPGEVASGAMKGALLSDGSRLEADHYVFACGPWLGRVFPDVIGAGVQPTRQEVYYFGTPAGDTRFLEGQMPVWVHMSDRVRYGIPGNDRRGFKFADDTRGEPFDPTQGERTATAEGIEAARKFVAERFPALAKAPLLGAEVCQYENSPDGHFIIDRHPEAKNTWLLGGGSGHGFKLGPALGEHVAGLVLGEGEPDAKFSVARLKNRDEPPKTQIETH